jgi:hypothetical protein
LQSTIVPISAWPRVNSERDLENVLKDKDEQVEFSDEEEAEVEDSDPKNCILSNYKIL